MLKLMKSRKKVMSYIKPTAYSAEEFRSLRTHLQFLSNKRRYRSLVITSPNDREGKSFITANLATTFTEQGKKVLIVDANLRNPQIHEHFNITNRQGLTNILISEISIKDAICKTDFGRLDLLPSGPLPPNPAKLLISKVMEEVMQYGLDHYDVVLLDSTSVLGVSDTRIIANLCEGVLLVLGHYKTKAKDAYEAKRVLDLADASVIGITLNWRAKV